MPRPYTSCHVPNSPPGLSYLPAYCQATVSFLGHPVRLTCKKRREAKVKGLVYNGAKVNFPYTGLVRSFSHRYEHTSGKHAGLIVTFGCTLILTSQLKPSSVTVDRSKSPPCIRASCSQQGTPCFRRRFIASPAVPPR